MPITINGTDGNPFTSRDVDGSADNFIYAAGTLAFTGSYTTSVGGDVLDWTTVIDRISSSACLQVSVWSTTGNLLFQYTPNGNAATALNAWRIKISASGSFGTELSSGAYPASITGDKISFSATFRKLL